MTVWRVGRKLGRTLYKDDVCVGMVDSVALAEEIVATMNGTPIVWWGVIDEIEGGRWWPRRFRSREDAEAHLEKCRGPGTRAKVLPLSESNE
jgi:hypothetical protein